MKIREIKAKQIITKSNLPDADYVINPYVGCSHACVYCYARFMKKFTGHTEPWGDFVDVRVNAPELIPAKSSKYKGKTFFISSVTDPYLPLERKYKLTRRILEKLIPLEPEIGIQSKSALIVRDIDLFKQFKKISVGLTITTLDDEMRKEVEPFTSSPAERIEAIKTLKAAGLETYVFIGPILPYLTDWRKIISQTKNCADSYMLENLNVAGTIWPGVKNWLTAKHPDLLPKYEEIYFAKPKSDYWEKEKKEIEKFLKEQGVKGEVYFHT